MIHFSTGISKFYLLSIIKQVVLIGSRSWSPNIMGQHIFFSLVSLHFFWFVLLCLKTICTVNTLISKLFCLINYSLSSSGHYFHHQPLSKRHWNLWEDKWNIRNKYVKEGDRWFRWILDSYVQQSYATSIQLNLRVRF